MKFETEESFFRAVYGVDGLSPAYIAEACRFDLDGADARKRLTTHIVNLMRSAFLVHERCTAQQAPDDLLGRALSDAAANLPADWRITILCQAGGIQVDLYDPADTLLDYPSNRTSLWGQVHDAVFSAINTNKSEIAA